MWVPGDFVLGDTVLIGIGDESIQATIVAMELVLHHKSTLLIPDTDTFPGTLKECKLDFEMEAYFDELPKVIVKNETSFCRKCGQHHTNNFCRRGKR